ncbi:MAG: hypothetical protein ACLUD0_06475 [Eubacterium ramulus]
MVETTTTITTVVPGNTVYTTVTVPAGTVAGGTTTSGTNAAGGNANGTTTGGTSVTGGNANETTTPGGTTDANGGQDADQDNTVENTDEQTPQGLVDLDDEGTPTGNIDAGKSESVKTNEFQYCDHCGSCSSNCGSFSSTGDVAAKKQNKKYVNHD